jgi:hypothetical protein
MSMKNAHQCLGFLDVFLTKEELAVEVAEVNGIKVDNMYLAKAGHDKILEQLTADTSSTNHQDPGLFCHD